MRSISSISTTARYYRAALPGCPRRNRIIAASVQGRDAALPLPWNPHRLPPHPRVLVWCRYLQQSAGCDRDLEIYPPHRPAKRRPSRPGLSRCGTLFWGVIPDHSPSSYLRSEAAIAHASPAGISVRLPSVVGDTRSTLQRLLPEAQCSAASGRRAGSLSSVAPARLPLCAASISVPAPVPAHVDLRARPRFHRLGYHVPGASARHGDSLPIPCRGSRQN